MTSTWRDLANLDLGGAVPEAVLRAGEKSLLAFGHRHGRPVMIKVLRTAEEFWRATFAHEIAVYRAWAEHPPPVRVPKLEYADGHRVLVLEHIPGHVVDTERYPTPLPEATLETVLETILAFAGWCPPPGVLAPVFDYPDRVERYHHAGFFTDADRTALHTLLADMPPPGQVGHGDPLPSNLLLAEEGRCVLLDAEFTGLFLPGFDLALLHILLANTSGAQDRVESLVREAGVQVPFLVNQAIVLSRELRLHTELPDSKLRQRRMGMLRGQWHAVRHQLHTPG